MRVEIDEAAQSSQAELMQEVSADLFQLKPEPCIGCDSEKIPA